MGTLRENRRNEEKNQEKEVEKDDVNRAEEDKNEGVKTIGNSKKSKECRQPAKSQEERSRGKDYQV